MSGKGEREPEVLSGLDSHPHCNPWVTFCLLAPGLVPGWKPALEAAALCALWPEERELCRSTGL